MLFGKKGNAKQATGRGKGSSDIVNLNTVQYFELNLFVYYNGFVYE